jgi:hypothetical protein
MNNIDISGTKRRMSGTIKNDELAIQEEEEY